MQQKKYREQRHKSLNSFGGNDSIFLKWMLSHDYNFRFGRWSGHLRLCANGSKQNFFADWCCVSFARFINNVLSTAQQVWLRKLGGAKPVVNENASGIITAGRAKRSDLQPAKGGERLVFSGTWCRVSTAVG